VRWTFAYEHDTDLMRYQEVDDDGRLQREIVKFGPTFDLVTATTKFTRLHARRSGHLAALARAYGDALAVLEYPGNHADAIDISHDDFDRAWTAAARSPQRRTPGTRPRSDADTTAT
jgi:hypothetical protein